MVFPDRHQVFAKLGLPCQVVVNGGVHALAQGHEFVAKQATRRQQAHGQATGQPGQPTGQQHRQGRQHAKAQTPHQFTQVFEAFHM